MHQEVCQRIILDEKGAMWTFLLKTSQEIQKYFTTSKSYSLKSTKRDSEDVQQESIVYEFNQVNFNKKPVDRFGS